MERNKGCMLRFFNIKFNGSDIQFILEIRLTSKFWLFLFLKFEVEIVTNNLSISEISLNMTKQTLRHTYLDTHSRHGSCMKTYQSVFHLSDTLAAELKQLGLP